MNTETPLPPHLERIGRQLTAAAHELNTSRPRRPLALLAPVAAAAVIAAVVLGTTAGPDRGSQGPRLTAANVLARAADVALQTSPVTPSPGQFIYTRSESGGQMVQTWSSVDGAQTSLEQFGTSTPIKLPGCVNGQAAGADPCTVQPAYFPGMPTNPDAMQAYLLRTGNARPITAIYTAADELNNLAKNVGWILDTDYLLPAQEAALYQFLATTPGITIKPGVTDVAGRAGIGVGWSFEGGSAMLIFDPTTYQYLGMTTIGEQGQVGGDALLQTAIVDSAGEQPADSSATPAQQQAGTGTSTADAARD